MTWLLGYDGFGNLIPETPSGGGNAPNLNINVDTGTNRVVASGVQYDAAGNMINDGTQAYTYDEANRLKTAGGSYLYSYSGLENKRILVYNNTNAATPSVTLNLYSPDGKRLGYYTFQGNSGWTTVTAGALQKFLYLGNKALTYAEDRIGSNGNYYPYGTPYSGTVAAESQAFGTYVQDSGSGLMYADQRYYRPGFGRFMTADSSDANIDFGNPTSLNRYVYTNGDPVNGIDPTGLSDENGDFTPGDPTQGPGGMIGADTAGSYSGSAGSDDPTFYENVFCPPSCGTDPPVAGSPPVAPSPSGGSPDWINPPSPPQANCVAEYVATGTVIGTGVGETVGGVGGAVVLGTAGTAAEPGGGTALGAWYGFELGSTGGALAGASFGGALGELFGNILCANGPDPIRGNQSQNDEARRARSEASKITGKSFTKALQNRFHQLITGQGYDYETILEIAIDLLESHG